MRSIERIVVSRESASFDLACKGALAQATARGLCGQEGRDVRISLVGYSMVLLGPSKARHEYVFFLEINTTPEFHRELCDSYWRERMGSKGTGPLPNW